MKKRYQLIFIVPIILNFFVTFSFWKIVDGNYVQYIDSGNFIDKTQAEREGGQIWDDDNFGHFSLVEIMNKYPRDFRKLLLSLNLSVDKAQTIETFIYLNLISYSLLYSLYKIQKYLFYDINPIVIILATIFYSYNIVMNLMWAGGLIEGLVPLLILAPYLVFIVIKQFTSSISLSEAVIVGTMIGITSNVVPFNLALYISILTPLLILSSKLNFKTLITILLTTTTAGLPYYYILFITYFSKKFTDIVDGSTSYLFSHFGVDGLFKFIFFWSADIKRNGLYVFDNFEYYSGVFYSLAVLMLWLITIYLVRSKFASANKRIRQSVLFLITTILLSMFFAKGMNEPWKYFNNVFYDQIPLSGLFRTPDTKFAIPVILSFATLIGILFFKIRRRVIIIILAGLILILVAPFFSFRQFSGNSVEQKVITIPNDYYEINELSSRALTQSRVLMIPGYTVGKFTNSYQNQDFQNKIFDFPFIYTEDTSISKENLARIDKFVMSKSSFNPGTISIGTVILRKDVVWTDESELNSVFEDLSANKYLELVIDNSVAYVYSLKSESPLTKIIEVRSSDVENYDDYEIKKISNSEYKLAIFTDGCKNLDFNINYYTNLPKYWNLSILSDNAQVDYLASDGNDEIHHGSWIINSDIESCRKSDIIEANLYFNPQSTYKTLLLIRNVLLLLIISSLLFINFKNKS